MQSGFNHNIRHKGVLFHVQTEDTGVQNPVIVTHLFVGGNIIATRRSGYEKFVSRTGLQEIVAAMMQEQHKEMMKDLVHGRLKAVEQFFQKNNISSQTHVVDEPLEAELGPSSLQKSLDRSFSSSPDQGRTSIGSSRSMPYIPKRPVMNRQRENIQKHAPVLDTSASADKTLDELILEFLEAERQRPK